MKVKKWQNMRYTPILWIYPTHIIIDHNFLTTTTHSKREWNISNKNCLAWNIAQTYNFCIPLDLLDTKDLKKTFKGQTQSPKPKISKFYNFFSWYRSYEVILDGKAINFSLKAIKTIERPYIGQLAKVRRRMWINVISLF